MTSYTINLHYLEVCFAVGQLWGHVTSSKVTKGFWPITPYRNKIQTRGWSHCVQLVKTHRMIYMMTSRSRDLRSTFDLDLSRSTYISFDADWREDHDDALSLFLSWLIRKLFEKNSPYLAPPFWLFRPLWRHLWPDLKMTFVKIVDLDRAYPMPFTACRYLALFSRSRCRPRS